MAKKIKVPGYSKITKYNRDIEYSPETVMSNVTNMRNDLQLYQQQLPFIVASSVENNISPMVKGILSDNYYIQV